MSNSTLALEDAHLRELQRQLSPEEMLIKYEEEEAPDDSLKFFLPLAEVQ